ncbi:MAG: hydroxyacid dehydrogenase [Proteobacteria bacterium]|nr:hydroxyacid dehydrogenase [Pseudomonadota bacterium]
MKALVTVPLAESGLKRLKELAEVDFEGQAKGAEVLTVPELKKKLADKQMVIVEFEPITREVIEATKLKIIACTRGGPQANIDIPEATERGIPVLYAPGRNATSVAELVICLMVAVARHVAHAHHLLKTGHYLGPAGAQADSEKNVVWGVEKGSPYMVFKGPELSGRTLGIIGLGEVGERVAVRAGAFEMNLLAYDPYIPEERITGVGARSVDLSTLLRESDFVTIHCKVTDETRDLIGEKQISMMKPTAYLINTARGVIVDEVALATALKEKRIAGAGLDVFQQEPLPSDSPLLQLDNVVLVPHIGGASLDVERHQTDIVVGDLNRLFSKERPKYCANPEVLESFRLT